MPQLSNGTRLQLYYKSNFLGCVLIAISCFNWFESQAADCTLGPNGPALNYHIDNVTIRLTRQRARGDSIQSVSLSGNGSATIERGGKITQLGYPTSDFLKLLNEFYRIRFFDLPVQYTTRYSVFLKHDGTVATSALRMSDAASTRVCVVIEEYEKCVTFGREGPFELESSAKRILIDVDKIERERQELFSSK